MLYVKENSLLNSHIIFETEQIETPSVRRREIGARHEHSSQKSFRIILQET
jgi:hypothetical protein